jgi:hypothetical protein
MFVFGAVLACAFSVCAVSQTEQPRISEEDGRFLVHEAIKKHASSAVLELMKEGFGDGFIALAAESPEGSKGSPIVGYFAVNAFTGDVWEIAGDECSIKSGIELRRLQKTISRRLRIDQKTYSELHTKKPSICN